MRTFLTIAVLLGGMTTTRADEGDDLLARQLAAVVRDPRLTLPQRLEAVRTLGKLGQRAGGAVPDLIAQLDRLRGREQESLQEAIVDALGRMGSPARVALPAIARTGGRSIDIDLAIKRTTDSLLASSDSQDVGALTKQLQSQDSSVRLRAVKALGNLGPAAKFAISDLVGSLNDKDADVRRAAIAALGSIQPEAAPAEQILRSIALDLKDPDATVRLLAVRSIARFGRRAAIVAEDLQPLLTDSDADVRKAAADTLARITPP